MDPSDANDGGGSVSSAPRPGRATGDGDVAGDDNQGEEVLPLDVALETMQARC